MATKHWIERGNAAVARSFVGRYFRLEGSGHPRVRPDSRFSTEIRAGLTTFFAMAYIISVNANIVSQSGGTCVCQSTPEDPICVTNTDYALCLQEVNRDLITATAAISALTSFAFGNLPIAAAPGMGLNAYFTYNVVGYHGTGSISYQSALTAVFIEGFIFLGLTVLGLRQWLIAAIPRSIKLATTVGIGLFLSLIGLTYSSGIGLITGAQATPLELGGCMPSALTEEGTCPASARMRNPQMWIGIFCGGVLTVFLMMYRVRGAMIAGILLVSIISWPRTTDFTFFPYTETGESKFEFFRRVATFHPIQRVLGVQDWSVTKTTGQFAIALITFLYVDILDCTGTLYAMAGFAGLVDPQTNEFEGSTAAYTVDAMGVSIGSLFGTSPVTAYIESGAGINEGGRTGLTAMVTGIAFFISIFFAPIFSSIPPWATGATLVIIGAMMTKAAADINWRYLGDAVPAFLTIAIMPFTYSIAYGLIAGIVSYILLNVGVWVVDKSTFGRLIAADKDLKETWTVNSGLAPWWMRKRSTTRRDTIPNGPEQTSNAELEKGPSANVRPNEGP